MNVDGIDVVIEGDGPQTVVMVHGWPDTLRLWDGQVEALRRRFRCVRFTLPGFDAASPRRAYALDEVVETMRRIVERACPGGPIIMLLHDWGCVFGYEFARRHPRLVLRVIGVDIGDAGSRRHVRSLGLKAKAMIFVYQGWLVLAWLLDGRLGDWMARTMAAVLRCPGERALVGSRMGYPYYLQWSGRLRRTATFVPDCPMLFAYGRRKPFMFHSTEWAREVASRPGNLVQAFDTGHWVMVAAREPFNRAVADWLAQGAAAAA